MAKPYLRKKCEIDECKKLAYQKKLCFFHIHNQENTFKPSSNKVKPWHKLYQKSKWKDLRNVVLSQEPLCSKCKEVGNVVDHIIDHRGNLKLFYSRDNLQTLCVECHAIKTTEDRIIKWAKTNKVCVWTPKFIELDPLLKFSIDLGYSEVTEFTTYQYLRSQGYLKNGRMNVEVNSMKQFRILFRLATLKTKEKPTIKLPKE